jgi:lincosamide nucleotidyltransferase A/C/D/E
MKAASVVALYRRLQALGIPIWLDGGWGVDALLGEQTRPHDDLDIVVEEQHLLGLRVALHEDGFKDVEHDDTSAWNFVLGHDDGRQIDVHAIVFDAAGNGIYGPAENGLMYPAGSLSGAGSVDGVEVKCLTAAFQVGRTGYTLRDKDFRDVRALCERFGLTPPASFSS